MNLADIQTDYTRCRQGGCPSNHSSRPAQGRGASRRGFEGLQVLKIVPISLEVMMFNKIHQRERSNLGCEAYSEIYNSVTVETGMKKLKFVASMLALGLGIACGNAQALITIDNFNTGVTVTDIGGGGSTSATDPPGVDRSLCQLCVFRAIENDQGVSLVSNDTPITVLST